MTSVLQPGRAAERTDDGRYVVVDGRRWRASDPGIPEDLLDELVSELMAARQAVASAKSQDDKLGLAEARRRVSDAKLALGERAVDPELAPAELAAWTMLANAMLNFDATICMP